MKNEKIEKLLDLGIPKYITSTENIQTRSSFFDRIIGQDEAKHLLKIAVKQKRHLLLIGLPGTGKSMMGKAYSEMLVKTSPEDLMAYPNSEDPSKPIVREIKNGMSSELEQELLQKERGRKSVVHLLDIMEKFVPITLIFLLIMGWFSSSIDVIQISLVLVGIASFGVYASTMKEKLSSSSRNLPIAILSRKDQRAPFIDATGMTSGGIFGDVLHDPYQSGDLAVPPHRRLIPGAVHKANKGVLYIDEIGTLSYETQVSLLSIMQNRKASIGGRVRGTTAATVRTNDISADFQLVAAGNKEVVQGLHPALRSRIQGYGYEIHINEVISDTLENRENIVKFISQEVQQDMAIPHFSREGILEILVLSKLLARDIKSISMQLRWLGGIVRAGGDFARFEEATLVSSQHVRNAYINRTIGKYKPILSSIPLNEVVFPVIDDEIVYLVSLEISSEKTIKSYSPEIFSSKDITDYVRNYIESNYRTLVSDQIHYSSYSLFLSTRTHENLGSFLILSDLDLKKNKPYPSDFSIKVLYDLFVLLELDFDSVVIPEVKDTYLNQLIDYLIPCKRITPDIFMEMITK